jgi:hypothetical protein
MTLFVICALPVLVWKARSSPVDLTPDLAWFDVISRGFFYNLFFLIAPYFHILAITTCGISALALFFIARRRRPSPEYDHTVTLFVIAVIIILVVEIVTAQWLPLRIIVQSQIIRAGIFGLIFGYLYFANYIVTRWEAGEFSRFGGAMLTGVQIASPVAVVPLVILGLQRFVRSPWVVRLLSWTTVAVTAVLALAVGASLKLFGPGIYIYPLESPWYWAQIWAKDHTAKGTWFITPPQIWTFYDSEWRVFSERSTVVTHSELLEAAFSPDYVDYWLPRFNDLAPGAFDKFRGDFFANQKITGEAFYQLTTEELVALGRKYGATYLVMEKPNWRDLPVCYGRTDAENPAYIIYALTPEAAAAANCQP